jgi:hypothetical protein
MEEAGQKTRDLGDMMLFGVDCAGCGSGQLAGTRWLTQPLLAQPARELGLWRTIFNVNRANVP